MNKYVLKWIYWMLSNMWSDYKDKKSMVEWLNQKAEDFDYELILGYKYDTKG